MDEDGRFTELVGPQLQGLSVLTEGTDKGKHYKQTLWRNSCVVLMCFLCCLLSDFHAEGAWSSGAGAAVRPQLPL